MGGGGGGELDYESTQPWRLAVFFLGFAFISVFAEKSFHWLLHHFEEQKKHGLVMMVAKFKDELMLLGFISLALVMCQDKLLGICVPACGGVWGKCYPPDDDYNATDDGCGGDGGGGGAARRMLGAGAPVECDDGQPFITITALHQIHIFIFVLAVSLIGMGSAAMLICLAHLHTWGEWESEHGKFDASLGDATAESPAAGGSASPASGREMNEYEKLEQRHGRRLYQFFCVPLLGVDKVTFLYLRRYFIRKHKRSKEFLFLRYIRECMQDDFAKTIEIDGNDWIVAMLTVAFRDYYFSLWASIITLCMSIVVGVKLSAISKMLVADVRDMVDRPTVFQRRRASVEQVQNSTPKALRREQSGDEQAGAAWVEEEMKLLEAAREAFQGVDDDDGGTLDKSEVRHLLEEMGVELDNDYYEQVFKRFDMDDSGELEYDEFLQCWRFMQSHKEEFGLSKDEADERAADPEGGKLSRTRTRLQSAKTAVGGLTRTNTKRPSLKKGRVTWCCGSIGPSMNPASLSNFIRVIMFQNAIVVALMVFNLWQLGSDSTYFQEPEVMPGGMFLLQGLIVTLQQVHTSFVLLPMFALVRQMGKHYNSRLFGDAAGKAILGWAASSKKRQKEVKKAQSRGRLMTGLKGGNGGANAFMKGASAVVDTHAKTKYLSDANGSDEKKHGKDAGAGAETPPRKERSASPPLEVTDMGGQPPASPLAPLKGPGGGSPPKSVGFASALVTPLSLQGQAEDISEVGSDELLGRAGMKLPE